jgi:hypothetical protein
MRASKLASIIEDELTCPVSGVMKVKIVQPVS